MKPAPRSPSRFPSGTRAVRERQLARVRGAPADLPHRRARSRSRASRSGRSMFEISLLAGARGDRHAGGDVGAGVRDEDLRAVDDPLAVTELGRRPGRARVGAGVRLGQAERGEPASRGQVGQPARASAPPCRRGRSASSPSDVCAATVIATDESIARQLLDGDRVGERVAAAAAVLLRDRDAHQPELGEPRDDVVREAVLAVELLRDGRDPLLGEGANRRAEQLVLLARGRSPPRPEACGRAPRSAGRRSRSRPCRV